jgi:DedD protein
MADPDNSVLEDARKRARRRLVGAVMLALVAAVVLPMFLESDPQPLGPDVQIQIPAIDDAKFQNRLTPAGSSKGAAADKPAPPEPSEPVKARESTDMGTVAAPAVSDPAATKTDPPAPAPAPAATTKPDQTKSTTPPTAAADSAAPGTPLSQAAASPKPTLATPPAAPATSPLTAAPARKAAAPAPARAAAAVPAASLPAFSLTATAPPLGAPAVPEPTSELTAAPPLAQGEFVVQLGAFVDTAVARDLAAKAGEQGHSVFLEAVTTKSGQVQRVRVGPFATRGEADAVAAKLKAAGFTAVARPRQDAARR